MSMMRLTCRGPVADLRRGTPAGNHGPYVLGVKALAQRGRPEPGRVFLPRHKERDYPAAPMLGLISGLLHEPEESVKIGGAFFERICYGKAQTLFIGRGSLSEPLPVMQKPFLTVLCWILNIRKIMNTSCRLEVGSVLISSTCLPLSASDTAVAQAMLVLPTPPFPVKKDTW